MNSSDPYTLIFSKPSPLRQVPNHDYKFLEKPELGSAFISCRWQRHSLNNGWRSTPRLAGRHGATMRASCSVANPIRTFCSAR